MMSTETIIEIETVVDDLTDHEFDTSCDVTYTATGDCPEPARWWGLKSCCGNITLMCTSCKDGTIETKFAVTECKHCFKYTATDELYIYLEPLSRH